MLWLCRYIAYLGFNKAELKNVKIDKTSLVQKANSFSKVIPFSLPSLQNSLMVHHTVLSCVHQIVPPQCSETCNEVEMKNALLF